MAEFPPLHVLVVDDDPDTRANLCDILEMDGHAVETAGSVAETVRRDNWGDVSAVILDRRLPDGTADELLPHVRQAAPDAAVLIVTGYGDLEGVINAVHQGAADYILKPINPQSLRRSLARIAERRALALAKERSEAAFRTLVEAAPCLILIIGADYGIAYLSPYAEELTGHAAADALGRDVADVLLPPEFAAVLHEKVDGVLAGRAVRGFETPVVCKNRTLRWVLWNAQNLPDYEGGPAVLAVGQDITERKQAQERALQSERLAAIGQMMTGLAHESGNALARSQACLEMLALEVPDRPEVLDLVERIQKAQNHLQHLYEEVRGYAAPLKLERESWDLAAVWRQAWDNLKLQRQGREVVLREDTGGLDLRCRIDHFRLEQVFRNAFDNSLAAARGPLAVSVSCSPAELDGRPAVRVSVGDNGPGLTPDARHRIFDPFFTTKTKGTGLGMAIARRIVEAHGGQIAVGSSGGPGAEIVLTLPRDPT